MDIGTAKPTPEEMRGVPHHMLDVADPAEDYSVARYVRAASACVDDILSRGRLPIVAGGTGLYIDNLVAGREFASFTGRWRERLQARAREEGLPVLYEELRRVDPQRAERLPLSDEKRILRALEVWYETGETITDHDRRTAQLPPRYRALRIGLDFAQRPDLWARIDARVDEMMDRGLEGEVRRLLSAGVPEGCTAMQAIGYKEFLGVLDGTLTEQEALELVKLRSRQYAKRQLTWLRRNPAIHWIYWEKGRDFARALQISTEILTASGLG
ncbi:tRNA (adenosine(37)-N6)-dimethylallyltransferase MiaA, partial [Dysosmobacter sp.]|uniref:tRNA (adenosine(37)-N6)-dimethylallyltransferase MiaA n=1 Tax=Dysosmobacter sp. TaxID=2591382 RepID=UPI00267144E2